MPCLLNFQTVSLPWDQVFKYLSLGGTFPLKTLQRVILVIVGAFPYNPPEPIFKIVPGPKVFCALIINVLVKKILTGHVHSSSNCSNIFKICKSYLFVCVSVCTHTMPTEAWRRAPDLLELGSQVAVSPLLWVLRTRLSSSGRAAFALIH